MVNEDAGIRQARACVPARRGLWRAAAALALAASPAGFAGAQPAATGARDAMTTEQVEAIVRSYLLRNPGVLREAAVALQRQEAAQAQARAARALGDMRADLLESPASPSAGNPKGDVTIVEFFDFRCGHCKRAASVVQEVLRTDPNVRVVYKQFPILGDESVMAARAGLAAHAQGRYQEFHRAMFELDQVDEATVLAAAEKLGLDMRRLRADMHSESVTREIEANARMSAPLGVTGTPGFIIGNDVAPGMLDLGAMRRMIAAARAAGLDKE